MTQVVIDFSRPKPAARGGDPQNSHAAASQAIAFAASHRAMIWHRLHEHGPQGRYAIARATGLEPVAVARRLAELVAQGLCRRVPGVCEITPTGRAGSVWEATA
jgi:predicted ArsR family transcriptional regulator